jgi:NAD(P)-dependent dehydrogenase (short-subunit alcohol dehydrogenase family)
MGPRRRRRTWSGRGSQYLEGIAKANVPVGRIGTPEELAHFQVFLCSPRAGSNCRVDGAVYLGLEEVGPAIAALDRRKR